MINQTVIYAIGCVLELAKRQGQFAEVREISKAQAIPESYCQKVLYALAKKGVLTSWKGRGFCLDRALDSLSLADILDAVQSVHKAQKTEGSALAQCLNERVNGLLKGLALRDLVQVGV
ncbi:MAG: hypothetical protein A3G41_00135 [Elusimicrobia bacterium RIFCSPLOWO2_12_FULL_59_9]|nr:MAG: hypothetical protein A3G41_00135 [Elusimicrobia bacterium RIFCSPLOWO2_12_FULL_59_9]